MLLLCTLNTEGSMLIWHDIVLVVRIDGLVLRCDLDLFGRQLDPGEVFEQVRVVRLMQVQKCEARVARLPWFC